MRWFDNTAGWAGAALLAALTLALNGCAVPPSPGAPGQVLSRLPVHAPGAAPAAGPAPLSQAEQERYARAEKQVMQDQAERSRVIAWSNAVAAAPVYYGSPYYSPYPAAYYPAYPAYYPYAAPYGYGYPAGVTSFSIGVGGRW